MLGSDHKNVKSIKNDIDDFLKYHDNDFNKNLKVLESDSFIRIGIAQEITLQSQLLYSYNEAFRLANKQAISFLLDQIKILSEKGIIYPSIIDITKSELPIYTMSQTFVYSCLVVPTEESISKHNEFMRENKWKETGNDYCKVSQKEQSWNKILGKFSLYYNGLDVPKYSQYVK